MKNVVLSEFIKPQIEEAALALSKGEGSDQLGNFMEKIKEIKQGLSLKQISYQDFVTTYKSHYNFNDTVSSSQLFNQSVLIGPEVSPTCKGNSPA